MLQRGCVFGLLLISTQAMADVTLATQFAATAEVVEGKANAGLSVTPSLQATFENKTAQFTSTNSALVATSQLIELQPVQWQSNNDLVSKFFLPSLTANAGYTHSESVNLLADAQNKSDGYRVGLTSTLRNGPLKTHVFNTSYVYTDVESSVGDSTTNSDSESLTYQYTHTRLLKSTALLSFNGRYIDYLNDVTSVSGSANLVKPLQVGVVTLNAGATRSYLVNDESTALTGAVIYAYTSPEQTAFVFSAVKQRSDFSTFLTNETVTTDIEANQLVDTTTLAANVSSQHLNGRLNSRVGYQISSIDTVTTITGLGSEGTPRTLVDLGSVNLGYALSKQSRMSVTTQFSLLNELVTVLGSLEYQKEIAKNLQFRAGIGSNDFSDGIQRYYASLNYLLGGAL